MYLSKKSNFIFYKDITGKQLEELKHITVKYLLYAFYIIVISY